MENCHPHDKVFTPISNTYAFYLYRTHILTYNQLNCHGLPAMVVVCTNFFHVNDEAALRKLQYLPSIGGVLADFKHERSCYFKCQLKLLHQIEIAHELLDNSNALPIRESNSTVVCGSSSNDKAKKADSKLSQTLWQNPKNLQSLR